MFSENDVQVEWIDVTLPKAIDCALLIVAPLLYPDPERAAIWNALSRSTRMMAEPILHFFVLTQVDNRKDANIDWLREKAVK